MNFEFEWNGLTIKVYDFYQGRPAPNCQNPDSPRFADPGDPAEWEFEIFTEKGEWLPGEFHDWIESHLEEEIFNRGIQEGHEREIERFESYYNI